MKTIKTTCLLVLILSLTVNFAEAQKLYRVHQDNVKPSMVSEYEKIAKEFNAACVEHNLQASWITATTSDLKYMYVTPMEKFAELDERPFAAMAEAMGNKFTELFERFDACYDSHGSYIIGLNEKLSYMPEGISQTTEGENYRDYFFIYYTPANAKKIREGMMAVKELFVAKASKNYYRIYHSGFGTMESYYMVAMSSKDEIDSATKSVKNKDVLGPDRFETFDKVMKYASRTAESTGKMRPDLAYSPKKE
ncbi:MAG: hypothetical protein ABJK28_08565 [Algibacter sp.]